MIDEANNDSKRTLILFGQKLRHLIQFEMEEGLVEKIKEVIKIDCVNAIHCSLHILALIQHKLIAAFPATKFQYCKNFVADIVNKDEQLEIISTEHNRAHRAAQENIKQILSDYYFPKMTKLVNEIVKNCKICSKSKYDRHPQRQEIGETIIPSQVGEILHIDIFSTDKKYFLTCLDKFSKFAVVQPIASRTIIDVKIPIFQLLNIFPNVNTIYCDNEKSLNSTTIKTLLNNSNINIVNSPPLHSTSNGQVERFHSTMGEIARCLKLERQIMDTTELIMQATLEYNRTVHSVIGKKPVEIINSFQPELNQEVKQKLINAQFSMLRTHNKNKQNKVFEVGERVYIKSNRRLGNKLSPLYEEATIEADMGTTVLIKGRVVHKDNLR